MWKSMKVERCEDEDRNDLTEERNRESKRSGDGRPFFPSMSAFLIATATGCVGFRYFAYEIAIENRGSFLF